MATPKEFNGTYRNSKHFKDKLKVLRRINSLFTQYGKQRLTIRQIYYRLVSEGHIQNNAQVYHAFDAFMTVAREKKDIDWSRIEDRSRAIHEYYWEKHGFEDESEFIDTIFSRISSRNYDKKYWADQEKYVEVWVEKDALSALFVEACEEFRNVVFPAKGNASYTWVMEALMRFAREHAGKQIVILYFGDLDPSGWNMSQNLQERLNRYSKDWSLGVQVEVKRVGLLKPQVVSLPSNPIKVKASGEDSDKNSAKYRREVDADGNTWELDVIEPNALRKMVQDAVQGEIDQVRWDKTHVRVEEEELRIRDAISLYKSALDQIRTEIKEEIEKQKSRGE